MVTTPQIHLNYQYLQHLHNTSGLVRGTMARLTKFTKPPVAIRLLEFGQLVFNEAHTASQGPPIHRFTAFIPVCIRWHCPRETVAALRCNWIIQMRWLMSDD